MEINARLKDFLESKGISQAFVARKIQMNQKTFNAVLNGHASLRAETLEAVCDVIGVSPAVFFKHRVQENETSEKTA